MTIMDAFSISGRGTVVTGRISSGSITVGDSVCIPMEADSQRPAKVEGIEVFRQLRERAAAGEDVGVLVGDVNYRKIAKGEDLVASCHAGKAVAADTRPGTDEPPRQANVLNDFRFEADGLAPVGGAPQVSQLTLAGGCRAPNQLSLGFLRGNLIGDDYFHFSMNASAPIEPGMTGLVEPVDLVWDNGVFVPGNLPPGVDAKVPQRLEGTGRITITSHTGTGMAGRMVATAEGEVTGDAGTARIKASFDMNLACGR
jgi:hypothetical protein